MKHTSESKTLYNFQKIDTFSVLVKYQTFLPLKTEHHKKHNLFKTPPC